MSDEKNEIVVFDKERFRELKAELRQIEGRKNSIFTEISGHTNKVKGLIERLENAEASKKAKRQLLLPEAEDLKLRSKKIQEEIEAL